MPPSRRDSPKSTSLANSLSRAAQAFLPRRYRRQPLHPHVDSAPSGRAVTSVFNACRQLDPDGLGIRRPSSSIQSDSFSPFLLLDHCGPHPLTHTVCGEAPRCGQQALTYIIRGEMLYRDSCYNAAQVKPGCASLLTAGSGLAVSHSLRGPIIEYISIWINIPREAKAAPPRHNITDNPPFVVTGRGEASARISVLASPGQKADLGKLSKPKSGACELETTGGRAAVYEVKMQRKSQLVLNPETERVFVYVYRGAAVINKKTKVCEGDFALLEHNRNLPLVIDGWGVHTEVDDKPDYNFDDFNVFEEHACWCLVLAGDPVMEPVSMLSSGIVACSPKEIRKAFEDYTCGSLGSGTLASKEFLAMAKAVENSEDDESTLESTSESGGHETDGDIPDVGFGKLE